MLHFKMKVINKDSTRPTIGSPLQRGRWKPWIKSPVTKQVNKGAFKIKSHRCTVPIGFTKCFQCTNFLLSLFSKCLMVLTKGFSPDPIYLIHNDDSAICTFLRGNSTRGNTRDVAVYRRISSGSRPPGCSV